MPFVVRFVRQLFYDPCCPHHGLCFCHRRFLYLHGLMMQTAALTNFLTCLLPQEASRLLLNSSTAIKWWEKWHENDESNWWRWQENSLVHYSCLPSHEIFWHFPYHRNESLERGQRQKTMEKKADPSSCSDICGRYTITSANICCRLIFISAWNFSPKDNNL